jgi:DNA mismatch repair ATPase MutL
VIGSFLLVDQVSDLFLVDLRDAYEERVLAVGEKQTLLWPLEMGLSSDEPIEEIMEHLQQAGLEVRRVGAKHLAIDALPKWLAAADVPDFLSILKSDLTEGIPLQETLRRYCRAVRRRFTLDEAEALWRQSSAKAQVRIEEKDLERLLKGKNLL